MTTVTDPSTVPAASAPMVDLDLVRVLQATADCVFAQSQAEAGLLEAAVRWADLNPVTEMSSCPADWWDGEGVPVPGAIPEVAAPAVVEFAAAAGLSSGAGKWLIFEALQLRHRMPRTWELVRQCRMPAFRARQLVMACYRLNDEAVGWLDRQTAAVAGRVGPGQIERMVTKAAALFDPEFVTERRRKRYVRIDHGDPNAGLDSSAVYGCLDPLDAVDLDAALDAGAAARKAWGATDDHDARRAQALGDLARARLGETPLPLDPDGEAGTDGRSDLDGEADTDGRSDPDSRPDPDCESGQVSDGRSDHSKRADRRSAPGVGARVGNRPVPPLVARPRELTLYVQLSDQAIRAGAGRSTDVDQVWLGEFGSIGQPITADLVRQWCGNPDATVIIKPVIDLRAPVVTEVYRPTDKQREHVALTDGTCAFPYCPRPVHPVPVRRQPNGTLDDSWDADHARAWRSGDDTSTEGLAGLCRQHHRGKTLHGWRYRRLAAGLVLWRSRHGMEYLRTPIGTVELGFHVSRRDRGVPGWLEGGPLRPPDAEPPPDPVDDDLRPGADPPSGRPPDRGGGRGPDGGQEQLPTEPGDTS